MDKLSNYTQQLETDGLARGFVCLVKTVGTVDLTSESTLTALERRLGPRHSFVAAYRQKAGVAAHTTDNFDTAALGRPFLDVFRRTTVLGQIAPGTLPAPPNVLVPLTSRGTPARFVGESEPIPAVEFLTDTVALDVNKLALIAAFTKEFLKLNDSRSTSLLERHLQKLVRDGEDGALLSNNAAIANEQSQGLLYGLTPVANGSPTSQTEDLLELWASVRDGDPLRPYFILSPRVAVYLASLRSGEGPLFPNVNPITGGNLFGIPVALSSAAQSKIILLDAAALVVSDNGLTVERSRQTAIQMRDDPVTGAQNVVSLFQSNAVAILLIRYLSWALAYDDAVGFIQLDLPAAGSPS